MMISNNDDCNSFMFNYNDACIYRKDLKLLQSKTEWLNDSCINFHMKRLENHRQQLFGDEDDDGIGCDGGINSTNKTHVHFSHVEFMDPSIVSFFMHQLSVEDDKDELVNLVQSWGLSSSKSNSTSNNLVLIIIPINDNNSASLYHAPGGLGHHWSLLIVIKLIMSREDDELIMYFHFDSSQGCNASTASVVANKIHEIYMLNEYTYRCDSNKVCSCEVESSIHKQKKKVVENSAIVTECIVPQQTNGHDCGIHTLFHAQVIGLMQSINFEDSKINAILATNSLRHGSFNDVIQDVIANQFQERIKTCLMNKYQNDVNRMTKTLRESISQDIMSLAKG